MKLSLRSLAIVMASCLTAYYFFHKNGVAAIPPFADTGSHFISGLLIFDWLHSGRMQDPIGYAVNYYAQLPYVGIGLWPPLFHLTEALLFSVLGASLLVAKALASATLAAGAAILGVSVLLSGRSFPVALGLVAAVLSSFLIQDVQRGAFIDGMVSTLCFAATLQFSRHISQPSWQSAFFAGALSILAFYSKGNAVMLGLAFPIAALALQRPRNLFHPTTLVMALACAAMTGPWLFLTAGLSSQGFLYSPGLKTAITFIGRNVSTLANALPILAPFAAIGILKIASGLIGPATRRQLPGVLDATCIAVLSGSLLFHAVIPAALDSRYMISALFAEAGLAVTGIAVCANALQARLPRTPPFSLETVLACALLILQTIIGTTTPLNDLPEGADKAAAIIIKALPSNNRSVLIAGDFGVESSVGPELAALEDNRRGTTDGIFVMRGSRAFSGGGYRNRDYQGKYATGEEYRNELKRLGMPIIVSAKATPDEAWDHIEKIRGILAGAESGYRMLATVPYSKDREIEIWALEPRLVMPIDRKMVSASNALRARASVLIEKKD